MGIHKAWYVDMKVGKRILISMCTSTPNTACGTLIDLELVEPRTRQSWGNPWKESRVHEAA